MRRREFIVGLRGAVRSKSRQRARRSSNGRRTLSISKPWNAACDVDNADCQSFGVFKFAVYCVFATRLLMNARLALGTCG